MTSELQPDKPTACQPEKPTLPKQPTASASQLAHAIAQTTASQWLLAISLIMGGCCSNVYTLEKIVQENPKSGDLITCAQFILVAADGLVRHLAPSRHSLLRPRAVPLQCWLYMVALFFTLSTLNNRALGYHISVPVHIIFRSGGLLVNMLVGRWMVGKRYSLAQVASILLVTVGVITTTWFSDMSAKQGQDVTATYSEWLIGIGLLVAAMFLTAFLGLYQERVYAIYGKQWRESMFYVHFLSLPMFLLVGDNILHQWHAVNASPPLALSTLLGGILPHSLAHLLPSWLTLPKLWWYLLFNTLTQYLCISGVNRLTSITSSLTVNLVLNVRKMVSLLLSIWLFGNRLSLPASIGCVLVFIGTLLYSYVGSQRAASTSIVATAAVEPDRKQQ